MIDLHTHSTASDGTDAPKELIERAAAAGIHTLGLTDHDSTAGWDEAAEAVSRLPGPFALIRGTEFSCAYAGPDGRVISVHLLGYLFDRHHVPLQHERSRLRDQRLTRGEAIVDNLINAGIPISWQQVRGLAGGAVIGRPHIGQALVEAGVVPTVSAAFADLLSSNSPHYVAKQDLPVKRAIELIHSAGGVAVLAHPWARSRGAVLDEAGLTELVDAGLLGLEVDHPDHSEADRVRLRELAAGWGILVTGASDYHGANKTTRIGAELTSPAALADLISLSSGRTSVIHS